MFSKSPAISLNNYTKCNIQLALQNNSKYSNRKCCCFTKLNWTKSYVLTLANTRISCHTQQRRHTQAPFLQFYFITRSLFSFSCCCCASVLTFYFVLWHREFYCAVYVNCYYTFMLAEIGYKCQKELPDCTKGQVPKQKQRNESGRHK